MSASTAISPSGGPLLTIGRAALLVFLFLSYSRASDNFVPGLRLPLIFSLIAFLMTVLSGSLPRAWSSSVGILLSVFTLWLIAAVPFSSWPGGSVALLTDHWLKSLLVLFMVAGLLRTANQCRTAMYAIGAATVVIALTSMALGQDAAFGRLSLDTGTLADPNELAQMLLMGMPFLMLAAVSGRRLPFQRPLAVIAVLAVLIVAGQTGSRMALITVALLAFLVVLNLSLANKMKAVICLAVAICIGIPFLSAAQRNRYLSMFGAEDAEMVEVGQLAARDSAEQRQNLLRESIALTFTHPLFGVGPGVFQVAQNNQSEQRGERGVWRETHNMYTQVSAEAGIPAFICFFGALVGSFRIVRSIYRAERTPDGFTETGKIAFCLYLSLFVLAVTGFFLSVAYYVYLPMIAGLSVALRNSVNAQTESVAPLSLRQPVRA